MRCTLALVSLVAALAPAATAPAQIWSNPTPINMPVGAETRAAPYGTSVTVAGAPATLTDITVILHGLTHANTGDLEILLVAPNNVGAWMLSDPGTATAAGVDVSLTQAGSALPGFPAAGALASASYRVFDLIGDDGRAPTPPAAPLNQNSPIGLRNQLNAAGPGSANGQWTLYVVDDTPGVNPGAIAGGWSLVLNNSPAPTSPTAFTYQGKLAGVAGGEAVDLRFSLHTQPGIYPDSITRVGGPIVVPGVQPAADGTVIARIDFGDAPFQAAQRRFLQVDVSPTGQNAFAALSPRQPIDFAPRALWAVRAGAAGTADSATTAASATSAGSAASLTGQANVPLASSIVFAPEASNSDPIALRRVNTADNRSTLRLELGDDSTNLFSDTFTIGTVEGGSFVERLRFDTAAGLNVRGDLRFGPTAEFVPPAMSQNLRVIHGSFAGDRTILSGTGFTVSQGSFAGDYRISLVGSPFPNFNQVLIITDAQGVSSGGGSFYSSVTNIFNNSEFAITVRPSVSGAAAQTPGRVAFLIIGPR